MDAVWQRLGARGRHEGRRPQPRPGRAGQALDPSPLAQRVRGVVLHPLRLGSRVAGRRRCTRSARTTASSTRPTTSSTRSSPGRKGSSTSSSARAIRPRSRGCRARGRSGWAIRGSRDATTIRGRSRRTRRSSSTASRRRAPRTSSTSTRSSTEVWRGPRHRVAARDARALEARGPSLAAHLGRPPRLRPALPLRRGGDLRHPRRHGDARALASAAGERRREETPLRAGPRRRTAAGHRASRTPSAPARTA